MHDDIARHNRYATVVLMLMFVVIVMAACAGLLLLLGASPLNAVWAGSVLAIVVMVISTLVAARATAGLTHAVAVSPTQAPMLHNVVDGLCLSTGMAKPRVYIVNDPAPNAFAFATTKKNATVAVTTGLLELVSRRELEGVLAHEFSHIMNHDSRTMTLTVTTVGLLALLADIFARIWIFDDDSEGPLALVGLVIILLSPLAARLVVMAISRRREQLADACSVEYTRNPSELRKALEKLEAAGTAMRKPSVATAHLWIASPVSTKKGKKNRAKAFDSHPPLAARIETLRRLEGLDPTARGPVDETIAGVPVDLAALTARRIGPAQSRAVPMVPPPTGYDATPPPV